MTTKNRNILIGAGVLLVIIYVYRRNKKANEEKEKARLEAQKKAISTGTPKQGEVVSGMSSYNDAVEFLTALQKQGYVVKVNDDLRKAFIKEYQDDISKADHVKVMRILAKPENTWTLEEEFFYKDNFINNVLKLEQ
jgi:glycine cleavage system H lipoate-binding protein